MSHNQQFNPKKLLLLQTLGILHIIEEYFFGFSNWATRHFGTTTQNWYLLSHLVLFLILAVVVFHIYKGTKFGIFSSLTLQVVVFTNGLFHIFTTIFWQEYAPGLISHIILMPISYVVFKMIFQSKVLSQKETMYSIIVGCVISVLIILSLFVNVPI